VVNTHARARRPLQHDHQGPFATERRRWTAVLEVRRISPPGDGEGRMLLSVDNQVSAGLVRIPVEVTAEAAVFRVVARGYDPGQVDAHVLVLEQELAELRWEHDDLAAQRGELAEQRDQQNRWRPSVRALGDRTVQLMCLAGLTR